MGEIIKGKPVGDALSEILKGECEALVKEGIQPKLAILRVGANQMIFLMKEELLKNATL